MNKQLCLFLMNFLLILGFIGFSVLIILDPEVMRGVTLEEYQNDYCSTANITDKNDPMSLVCNNKFKKEKFIWILLDGLAFDQLYMLPQREANSLSNFFRIKSKEYKQSGSLHESIFTGKFSRNYPAKKMAIDHLFKQTKLSNIPVVYKGSYFPVFYLLGREKNEVLDSYELRGPEGFALNGFCSSGVNNIYDGYPSSFRKDITDEATEHLLPGYDRKFIYDKLNEHYADNMKKMPSTFNRCILDILGNQMKSYAYYTMRIDHLNHSYDKHYIGTIFDVYTIETTVLGLHRWADEHPEYAIIVSSDHGGQPYNGQDNICNHGCDVEGNEAVLMIYTKELGDVKYKLPTRKIWVNDVAPTITQIIKGVNIPLEAQGIPREIGDDNTLRYTAVKSKEVQLIQYITKFSEKFPKMKKKMMNYIDKIKKNELYDKIKTIEQVEEFSNAEYYKAYMNYLENIQDKLFSDIAGKGKSSFLYIGSFYLIWLLLLIKVIYEYRAIQNIVKEDNKKSAIKTSDLILDLIVIALICEVIACFFLSKKKIEDVINIARIVELGVMALLSFFIMIKFKMTYLYRFVIMFVLLTVTCGLMLNYELFINMKIFFDTAKKCLTFNIAVNYPIALIYLIYELYTMRNLYIDSKLRVRLLYVIVPYITMICTLIVIFDKNERLHFVFHKKFDFYLTRVIYGVLCFYGLLCFKNLYKKVEMGKETKGQYEIKKEKAIPNAKMVMFLFVFFICDETERSIMLFTFILANLALYTQFISTVNAYWRILSAVSLLILPDIIFISSQNSFSFDISLEVTSKCVGWWADQTPILTGILFGCHKLKLFMLTAGYLLSIARASRSKFMKDESFMLRLIMDIQMTFIIALYFYYLKNGMEEHYLQIFIWIMSKCMTSVIFDLCFMLWYCVYRIVGKCNHFSHGKLVEEEEKKDEPPADVVIELGSEPK